MKISSQLLSISAVLAMGFTATKADAQSHYYPTNQYGYNQYGALGQNVHLLNQYGNQMSYLYGIESRNYCGCRHSSALMTEIQRYNAYTSALSNAYRGTCPTTFKRAACNVRDSLTRIQGLHKRARVSHQVCHLIDQSYPLATYVHSNCARFQPVSAPVYGYPQQSYCPTPAPVVIQRNHGHHHYSHRDRGLDVKSAIFGAVAGRVIHGVIHGH